MGRRARSRGWEPASLPAVRDEVVTSLRQAVTRAEAQRPLYERAVTDARMEVGAVPDTGALRDLARELRGADLYWVSEQMTRLALDASAHLPAWTPSVVAPSLMGMLVWQGACPS